METFKLVRLDWLSPEREKYIWEDMYVHSWDEIIGRMYLLKAQDEVFVCVKTGEWRFIKGIDRRDTSKTELWRTGCTSKRASLVQL